MHMNKQLIIDCLKYAPSGGNSKPYLLDFPDNNLTLSLIKNKTEHYLNRNHHADYINLGCACFVIWLALRYQNYNFKLIKQTSDGPKITLKFTIFEETNEISINHLYNFIFKRKTYRKQFIESEPSEDLSLEVFKLFEKSLKQSEEIISSVHFVSSKRTSKPFLKYLLFCEEYLWHHTGTIKSVLSDLNFDMKKQDGEKLPITSFSLNKIDIFFIKLIKRFPIIGKTFIKLPILKNVLLSLTIKNLKNSHFFLVTSSHTNKNNLIQCGAMAMFTWLTIGNSGYKLQPLSGASLTLVDAKNKFLPEDTKKAFLRVFSHDGPEILKNEFGCSVNEFPVWMFRYGKIN